MHEYSSCKYGEKSWREDASLFNTIVVRDLTGELVVYQNSHCHVSMQALQDSDNVGGTSHFFHDDPQSIAVHGVNALVKSTKAMYRLRCCYLAFSISCLTTKIISSKAAL